jgi:TfoX/Sxy family transcriptional regulator of competence genes
MKYIYGKTNVEYVISGVKIPPYEYSEKEKAKGKRNWTEVSEATMAMLLKDRRFLQMRDSGIFEVSSTPPKQVMKIRDGEVRTLSYAELNAKLTKENAELKKTLDEAVAELGKVEQEKQNASKHGNRNA